jgi:hypothetical protein
LKATTGRCINVIQISLKCIYLMSQPQPWARDQGKCMERCRSKVQPGSHICIPRNVKENVRE